LPTNVTFQVMLSVVEAVRLPPQVPVVPLGSVPNVAWAEPLTVTLLCSSCPFYAQAEGAHELHAGCPREAVGGCEGAVLSHRGMGYRRRPLHG
jgi:hypothetical protein